MRRRRFFVRRVKATNTGRPAVVRPTTIMRSSSPEYLGSGATRGAFRNNASISSIETPCLWHFARLPPSQSNPVTRRVIIAVNYANVYTNVDRHMFLPKRGRLLRVGWKQTESGSRATQRSLRYLLLWAHASVTNRPNPVHGL